MTKIILLILFNLVLIYVSFRLFRKRKLLIQFSGGRWYLTWLSIALITFIVELSAIFYAPSEIYRSLSVNIFFFILISYLFYHYITTRFVEISEIMEINGIKEGGVYSFAYLVLGPNSSFLIVSSLLVTYLLTACLSSLSIFGNNSSVLGLVPELKMIVVIGVIWLVAVFNIMGIRLLPRITFLIFIAFTLILLNLIALNLSNLDINNINTIASHISVPVLNFWSLDIFSGYGYIIFGLSICSLSFNSLESIISNFRFAKEWKVIGKSYVFLFLFGLFIPILIWLLFSFGVDSSKHYEDLIPYYFSVTSGPIVGIAVGIIAGVVLLVVVNFSFNAFSDLIEKVSNKFNFKWFLSTNKNSSLYKIHLLTATLCSFIILSFYGNQAYLAEMLALAILTNISIILGCLLIYRYFRGTEQIMYFNTSRMGTLVMFIILISCLIYLSSDKIVLSLIWVIVITALFIVISKIASRYPTEKEIRKVTDNPMDIVFQISENQNPKTDIYFIRTGSDLKIESRSDTAFISFYSPHEPVPPKLSSNHFRFPIIGPKLLSNIEAIIEMIEYEIPTAKLKIHFGWPLSSWLDRLSIGVMIFAIMRMPREYPEYEFSIEYNTKIKK